LSNASLDRYWVPMIVKTRVDMLGGKRAQ
jgi:hypothetical protein